MADEVPLAQAKVFSDTMPQLDLMARSLFNGGASYTITLLNKTGASQSYALFSQPPSVKPTVERLTSHAILVARDVAARTGNAFFTFPRDKYHAICGVNQQDDSVHLRVLDRCAVTLGSGRTSNFHRGTTCAMDASSATPFFASWAGPADDQGEIGAFCLRTPGGFTFEKAKNNHWIAGLGLSTSGNALVGIYASFTPGPRTDYQIGPSQVFYIVPRALDANDPTPDDLDFSQECKLDFASLSSSVELVHDDDNVIRIFNP